MKQSWQRPSDGQYAHDNPSEHEICRLADFKEERISFAYYVQSSGTLVNTLDFIRRNVSGTLQKIEHVTYASIGAKRTRDGAAKGSQTPIDPRDREAYQPEPSTVIGAGQQVNEADPSVQPTCRTQTRLFMRVHGLPIKYFASLRELLLVAISIIKGHHFV
jgi:hypothetical protein